MRRRSPAPDAPPRARPARASRRVSLYGEAYRHRNDHLDDLIPQVLSVVAPHVDALEEDGHPVAALMGDRLRRSLVRLEPMLDQTLAELKTLREADASLAAAETHLREALAEAAEAMRRHALASPTDRTVESILRSDHEDTLVLGISLWDDLLSEVDTQDMARLRERLSTRLEHYVVARHSELHARLVLTDTHQVLRAALLEVTRVGRACEKAFPHVAARVEPRPLSTMTVDNPVHRFDVQ